MSAVMENFFKLKKDKEMGQKQSHMMKCEKDPTGHEPGNVGSLWRSQKPPQMNTTLPTL